MPTPHGFVERLAELSQSGVPFVCVTMVEAVGSTPQDAGSKMLVTAEGLVTGTVGGGRVEHKAIEHAREMLAQPVEPDAAHRARRMEPQARRRHDLRRHGEAVFRGVQPQRLADRRVRRRARGQRSRRAASAGSIATSRASTRGPNGSTAFRTAGRLRKILLRRSAARSWPSLPDDAFVVCMTMGHATDRPILEEIFRQGRTVSVPGRHRQQGEAGGALKELAAAGIPAEQAERSTARSASTWARTSRARSRSASWRS